METKIQTFTDLAQEYNVSIATIYKWIKPIKDELLSLSKVNDKRLRTLNKTQLQRIYDYLGTP